MMEALRHASPLLAVCILGISVGIGVLLASIGPNKRK